MLKTARAVGIATCVAIALSAQIRPQSETIMKADAAQPSAMRLSREDTMAGRARLAIEEMLQPPKLPPSPFSDFLFDGKPVKPVTFAEVLDRLEEFKSVGERLRDAVRDTPSTGSKRSETTRVRMYVGEFMGQTDFVIGLTSTTLKSVKGISNPMNLSPTIIYAVGNFSINDSVSGKKYNLEVRQHENTIFDVGKRKVGISIGKVSSGSIPTWLDLEITKS